MLLIFLSNLIVDINECDSGDACHVNAICNNTIGAHECTCKPGYKEEGSNCTGTEVFCNINLYSY